jgi:hypothetical protein
MFSMVPMDAVLSSNGDFLEVGAGCTHSSIATTTTAMTMMTTTATLSSDQVGGLTSRLYRS